MQLTRIMEVSGGHEQWTWLGNTRKKAQQKIKTPSKKEK